VNGDLFGMLDSMGRSKEVKEGRGRISTPSIGSTMCMSMSTTRGRDEYHDVTTYFLFLYYYLAGVIAVVTISTRLDDKSPMAAPAKALTVSQDPFCSQMPLVGHYCCSHHFYSLSRQSYGAVMLLP